MTDPRIATLAEALYAQEPHTCDDRMLNCAAAIIAALPDDWCGHATPPEGTRLILASDELLDRWGTRTASGAAITAEWGEPTPEGWYEPVFTTTDDGKEVVDRAEIARLRRIEEAARLPHNVVSHPDFAGEWVMVPRADFDALRAALKEDR